MARLIVGSEDDELAGMMSRLGPCLTAHGVRWIHSHLSAARTRMIREYEASDAEAVRLANREAGVRFDSVWPASLHEP